MTCDVGLDLGAGAECKAELEGVREGSGRSRERRGDVGRELMSGAMPDSIGEVRCGCAGVACQMQS